MNQPIGYYENSRIYIVFLLESTKHNLVLTLLIQKPVRVPILTHVKPEVSKNYFLTRDCVYLCMELYNISSSSFL